MRRRSLAYIVCLLIVTNLVHAQSKTPAMEAYLKWRDQAFAQLPSGINTPHYALAATVQRLDARSLKVELVVVGQTPAYSLEVQPLIISGSSDGQRQEKAGKLTTSNLGGMGEPGIPNLLSQAIVIVPASANANAVEITWKYRAQGEQMAHAFISFEKDLPSTAVMGIVP
jgi:hypothetical protein